MRRISLLIFTITIGCISQSFAQSSRSGVGGNMRAATPDYLGWDNTGIAGSLQIRNDFNQPIQFHTNGVQRMHINENLTGYTYLGNNIPVNGYIGIGVNPTQIVSRFTITGGNNSGFGGAGIRPWMQTGVFSIENSDGLYVGMKDETPNGAGNNRSDAVIAWSDDPTANGGVDNLRFLFTSNPVVLNAANPRSTASTDGYEYMRMCPFPNQLNSIGSPVGYIGIGPMFTNAAPPQNRLHINAEDNLATFVQISNELGTGQTANDGFHIGYAANNLEAQIIQRENANLTLFNFNGNDVPRFTIAPNGNVGVGSVFTTAAQPQNLLHVNNTGNSVSILQITNQSGTGQTANDGLLVGYPTTNPGVNLEARINQQANDRLSLFTNKGERIRITQIGALNNSNTIPTQDGIAGSATIPGDRTRIGISHDPANPVTRPLSLLHLGYDASSILGNNNGWRSWMDVGMYISQETDNVYLGLKRESANDRQDAVLSWGDNQIAGLGDPIGPDNFRMIFTSVPVGLGGTAPAIDENGLEGLRMTPTLTTGIFTGIGGDPSFNQYFGPNVNPTATLEVNSWGATNATGGSSGLRFTNLNTTSPTIANPGQGVLSVDADGDVIYVPGGGTGVGNFCNAAQNPLVNNDFEIPLNNLNYRFTNPQNMQTGNKVAIGIPCGTGVAGKLHVEQTTLNSQGEPSAGSSIAGYFHNTAMNGQSAVGVVGDVRTNSTVMNVGGWFNVNNAPGGGSTPVLYGVYCDAPDNAAPGTSTVLTEPPALALYADGDIYVKGTAYLSNPAVMVTSDAMFKTNIDTIQSALAIINQLNPVTYEYDSSFNERFNFPTGTNYGFIAQEVEQVLPDLVTNTVAPPRIDSAGNVTDTLLPYKALNYQGIIPVLTKALQEQQQEIASKDSVIEALRISDSLLRMNDSLLNNRLSSLESCINALNLCDGGNGNGHGNGNNGNGRGRNKSLTEVHLQDAQAIVLEQNQPNPFAEQTTINYYLPDYVNKAEILFYNVQGRLVQSAELSQKGEGQLTVFAQDLSSGIYTYTLVVDGTVFETKKMVKQ